MQTDEHGAATPPKYVKKTADVRVEVEPFFLESESLPSLGHYVWSYRVAIFNEGAATVRLLTRYWRITDNQGGVREVRGEGVVGEQPSIALGQSYAYMSGAPLTTPSGVMGGSYRMEAECGALFDVEIPTFSLDSPHERRILN